MKKLFVFCLALLLLAPAASATERKFDGQTSDWAWKDVEKAVDLGFNYYPYGGDFREPIRRVDFAGNASFVVARKFDTDLNHYIDLLSYRLQKVTGEGYKHPSDVAKQIGILMGRDGDNLDEYSFLTRQEAAVMLARTYRAYGGEAPGTWKPSSFTDQRDIANWAMNDVQLMNHLGIMSGDQNGRFNPLGIFTAEECYVTLVRLYEKTTAASPKMANPFAIVTSREEIIASVLNGGRASDFQFETKDYYILIWEWGGGTMAGSRYHIVIIDQDLSYRDYPLAVIEGSNCRYGERNPKPEDITVSPDGTKLCYKATVNQDVYYNGFEDQGPSIQLKGTYSVTMDLKTGKQTYIRTDLK